MHMRRWNGSMWRWTGSRNSSLVCRDAAVEESVERGPEPRRAPVLMSGPLVIGHV